MQRGWPLRLLWLASHDRSTNYCDDNGCTDYHNVSHYRSTNYGDDDSCSDYHNASDDRSTNYCDYHIAKLWKLQRCLGSVWWQELDWPHLLRLRKHMQVLARMVLSVPPRARQYRSTNDCDYNGRADFYNAKPWKLQRCLGSVWWQELDGSHLLRPRKYVQVFEPVVFSVHPAVNMRCFHRI